MPVWLLSLFTNKYTWIALGAAALGAYLYFGPYRTYEHMKAQAALVPGLQAQVQSLSAQAKANDDRAGEISRQLDAERAKYDQAEKDIGAWKDLKDSLDKPLAEMSKNASASKNAICLPSLAERQLWNATLAALTAANPAARPAAAEGGVPAAAGGN